MINVSKSMLINYIKNTVLYNSFHSDRTQCEGKFAFIFKIGCFTLIFFLYRGGVYIHKSHKDNKDPKGYLKAIKY